MSNNATSEKAYRSFKKFRLYARVTMLLLIFGGAFFLYIAIATALNVPEVISHFGRPEGVPVAFGILGLLFFIPGVVTFWAIGKYPEKDKLIDVLDDADSSIRDQYKLVRTIGVVLMAIGAILACICAVAFTFSLTLFVLATFGLTLLGYMNEVSMFTFLGIGVLSWAIFMVSRAYYQKRL